MITNIKFSKFVTAGAYALLAFTALKLLKPSYKSISGMTVQHI